MTITGFPSKEEKEALKLKIERMGGIYANAFHEGVTHLVADVSQHFNFWEKQKIVFVKTGKRDTRNFQVCRSRKYDVAMAKDIPVMTSDWVDAVWSRAKHANLHATDKEFIRYKCPALKGLVITISQLYK